MLMAHGRIDVTVLFSEATETVPEEAFLAKAFVRHNLFYVLTSGMGAAVVQGIASYHSLFTFCDAVSYESGLTGAVKRLVGFVEGALRIFHALSATA